MRQKMNKTWKILCLGLVMVFALNLLAPQAIIEAQAAKTVTTKKCTVVSKITKKAPTVKNGTTTVTDVSTNSKTAFIKFKAPSKGTYQFKFTMTSKPAKGKSAYQSNITLCEDPKKWGGLKSAIKDVDGYTFYAHYWIKTEGSKKAQCLSMASEDQYDEDEDEKIDDWTGLKTRTATLKLKKGETVVIAFDRNTGTNVKKIKYKMTIKKIK